MSKEYFDQSYISQVTDAAGSFGGNYGETVVTGETDETEPIEAGNGGEVGGTEVINPFGTDDQQRRDPVVGWLVCVKGSDFGADFRIHEGWNTIGRDTSNDIVINDPTVSAQKVVTLLYDDPTKAFIVARGEGRNPSRVNGRPLVSEKELAAFDKLTVGETELIFVPLCGEQFSWKKEE